MANKNKQRQRKGGRSKKNASRGSSMVAVTQPNFVGPFPPMMTAWTRYVEKISTVESSAGTGVFYVWTPSSLYDPNNTGTGHQPMYFDQLCAAAGPYTRYRPMKSRLRLTYVTTSTDPTTVGAYVTLSSTSPSSITQALEKPAVRYSVTGPATGANNRWTCNWKLDHAKCMCVTKSHLMDDDYYAADYTSSPTRNFFITTFAYGGTVIASGYWIVEIDTFSQFYALANAGSS